MSNGEIKAITNIFYIQRLNRNVLSIDQII